MGIEVAVDQQSGETNLLISGSFTATEPKMFVETYRQIDNTLDSLVIDLRQVEYIDSTALSKLVFLKKYFDAFGMKTITIRVSTGSHVEKVLSTSGLETVFTLRAE